MTPSKFRIHHLNCGSIEGIAPLGHHLVCHCLAIETPNDGVVLVDTGFGVNDLRDPSKRLGRAFAKIYGRPEQDPSLAALSQLKRLGFQESDVRNIILTHMDLDHVGGLIDFPKAKVHVHQAELEVALKRPNLQSRNRYKPVMWEHGPQFISYRERGERWKGFNSIQRLEGLPPEILLVPTFGHTRGHTSVAIDSGSGWLLHAGDAYYDHREIYQTPPECPPFLKVLQFLNDDDRKIRLFNQERLRELVRTNTDVEVFSAHDPYELELMQRPNRY